MREERGRNQAPFAKGLLIRVSGAFAVPNLEILSTKDSPVIAFQLGFRIYSLGADETPAAIRQVRHRPACQCDAQALWASNEEESGVLS